MTEPGVGWAAPELVEELGRTGIHPLHVPTPFGIGDVNAYLIDDDPLTLIDTGPNWGTSLEELESGIRGAGFAVEDVGLIVLTHQHMDHEGLAGYVARKSGAEVASLDLLTSYLSDFRTSITRDFDARTATLRANGVPEELAMAAHGFGRLLQQFGASVTPTRPVADGATLDLRDRTLRFLFRPGHSPSDVLVLDEARQIAFTGDHLLPAVSSNALVERSPAADAADERTRALLAYRRSLEATRGLELAFSLPGHGEPIRNHRELIDERLARQDRRAAKLLSLLDGRPRSAHDLAREMWGDTALSQPFLTVSEVLGHLDLLVERGEAAEARQGGSVVFGRGGYSMLNSSSMHSRR